MKTIIERRGTKGRCPKAQYLWDNDTYNFYCQETGKYCLLAGLETPETVCLFYNSWQEEK